MNTVLAVFVSQRYFTDTTQLNSIFEKIKSQASAITEDIKLICGEKDLAGLNDGGNILIALPASGSVQPNIIKAAEGFDSVIVYAGYVDGNFDSVSTEQMLINNAAPSCADVYSVLKRGEKPVFLCKNAGEIKNKVQVLKAYHKVRNAKLLLIGEIEPWVISADRNLEDYKTKLGVTVEKVALSELTDIYNTTTPEDAKEYYDLWKKSSGKIIEPDEKDLNNASRLNKALLKLIESHNADGAAIACFRLIDETSTTACLAVSYINTYTPYVAACEGDVDSAVSMLISKALSSDAPWMANPNLQKDDTVNFVHCSAPTTVGNIPLECILRNHHETGVGVSTQIQFPLDRKMTAVRISDSASKITVQNCSALEGMYQPSCRTQLRIKFEDYDKYISTLLGCHQIFTFRDIKEQVLDLAGLLGLEIL